MSDGDLFREVDQAVRHERYRLLWDRYGYYVIGAATLIVLVVAGYRGWVYWQETQAQETGAEFASAMHLLQTERGEKAENALQDLAADAPGGYGTLARFQLAAADAEAGKIEAAVARYDAIAEDRSVDPILRGNAVIQAATLRLPEADYDEIERRLKPLIDQNSPWRYSAYDLLGLSAYRAGDLETAQDHFSTLLADGGTPANLRERTTVMLAVISGGAAESEGPEAGESPGAADAAPAEESAPPAEATPEGDELSKEGAGTQEGEETEVPDEDAPAPPAEGDPTAQQDESDQGEGLEAERSPESRATNGGGPTEGAAPAEEAAPSQPD